MWTLAPTLRASNDPLAEVSRVGASVICSVLPSHVSRATLTTISPHVASGTRLVCASKGIETETLSFMGDVAARYWRRPQAHFVALSGPSFAEEVQAGHPTAIVAASRDAASATAVQQLFSTTTFRVYTQR